WSRKSARRQPRPACRRRKSSRRRTNSATRWKGFLGMDGTRIVPRIGLRLGLRQTWHKRRERRGSESTEAAFRVGYLPWLDVLRFVACLMVIVSHVNPYEGVGHLGHTGVGLFFSISGFLIGSVLMQGRDKPAWQATCYANRIV